MSLYAVKNGKGEWLSLDDTQTGIWYTNNPTLFKTKSYAEAQSMGRDAHVVELVEQFDGGNITNKEAIAKIIREAKRYADDYISEDTLEFEIKTALNAYKHAGASEKVVVNEKEASLLEKMADGTNFNGERGFEPGLVITNFVLNNPVHGESHFETEDRLMRAYVLGWVVEKPKRYVLPMPDGADDDDPDDTPYAAVNREYHAGPAWYQGPSVSFEKAREQYSVTQADIDAAPAWVRALTPVEVKD